MVLYQYIFYLLFPDSRIRAAQFHQNYIGVTGYV